MPVMATASVVLLAVVAFVGLVLGFALLAGRCREVEINARLGKVIDIGTHVRFDTETTRPIPKVEVVRQYRDVDAHWPRPIPERQYAGAISGWSED